MSDWMIGARYVCPRCLVRGWTIGCPRCTQPRADMAHDEGLTRLMKEWPEARAWRVGRSFFSPWTIRSAGRVCALAAVLALAVRSRETAVRGTAVLSEPLRIHRLVDEGGWMTRRDAHLPAVRITLDGRDLSLEVSAGSITLPLASGTRENAASPVAPSYREAAALELPAHIDGHGRGRNSQRTLPEGTQLLLRGGSLEGSVLRGAKHAPLWIEVL